jgi:tetratricopeptide (TPR) repeat protein
METMGKKKKKGREGKRSKSNPSKGKPGRGGGPSGSGKGSMERAMSEISRLLSQQEFDSIEDANRFLQGQLAGRSLDDLAPDSVQDPLGRAQELMYEAWDATNRRERIRLAEAALEISPDCADAYNLLAEEKARSVAEARAHFEQGVRAGERALGPVVFEEEAGHFWGIIGTRPYMRSRAGLGECLWLLGEKDDAVSHYQEMLRLNPHDNQGIRYTLLQWLLELDRDEEVEDLLGKYDEDWTAAWLYTQALWIFRREGESSKAEAALSDALEQNPHVPPYLLGEKKVPSRLPEYMGFGDEREARAYAAEASELWRKTDGARGWLLRSRGNLS